MQCFFWVSSSSGDALSCRVPFVIDVSRSTFESLNVLLTEVIDFVDGRVDWPPTQDKECIAVAVLNLLRLQVRDLLGLHRVYLVKVSHVKR